MNPTSNLPNFDYENANIFPVIGIDEVGRGCFAGPVVAACVYFPQLTYIEGVKDSKLILEKKREYLSQIIKEKAIWSIGEASPAEIDEVNILKATKIAMLRAYEQLKINAKTILVDGNQTLDFGDGSKVIPIVKGDSKSMSIAAASIIAKVHRDNLMKELALIHPEYSWHKNAGYGTKLHLEAIEKYGYTTHHRKSFKIRKKELELI